MNRHRKKELNMVKMTELSVAFESIRFPLNYQGMLGGRK